MKIYNVFHTNINFYKEPFINQIMKGILVVVDGMADLPCSILNGQTPLEAANMPNLNFLAARGEFGYMYPVKP